MQVGVEGWNPTHPYLGVSSSRKGTCIYWGRGCLLIGGRLLLVHPPELLILLAFAGNCNSSRVFEKKEKKKIEELCLNECKHISACGAKYKENSWKKVLERLHE